MTRRYTGGFLSATEQATDSNTANGIYTLSDAAALTAAGNFPTGRWTPQRSLRFRNSASAYLSRVPSTSSNRTTWTWSAWVKWTGVAAQLFGVTSGVGTSATQEDNRLSIELTTSGQFNFYEFASAAFTSRKYSTARFRDPSAWYHLIVAVDYTQSIADNRIKLYVNGKQLTSFESTTTPTQNLTSYMNGAGNNHTICGQIKQYNSFGDGYISELNFIDGQALDATYFGATDPETGTWVPKRYTGTYGTNGFYLPFNDNTSLNTIAQDKSLLASELITNGNFNADVSGWTVGPGVGGSPSITLVSGAARIANSQNNGSSYYQSIPTTIGNTYYVRGYVSNISIGASGRLCKIQWGNSAGSTPNDIGSVAQSSGSGWISGTFVATATTTFISLNVDILGSGTQGADWDNISVSETGYKNNWNTNNISLTLGATYDSMVDVPGLGSQVARDTGGVMRANYCTLNPLRTKVVIGGSAASTSNLSNGNLTVYGDNLDASGTIYIKTGKWYYEGIVTTFVGNGSGFGWCAIDGPGAGGSGTGGYAIIYRNSGDLMLGNGGTSPNRADITSPFSTSWTTNDIIGCAIDVDLSTVYWYKNGSYVGSYSIPVGQEWTPMVACRSTGDYVHANFGQRPFSYSIPTGFKTLCTTNLPNPVIKRAEQHFEVKPYTGIGKPQVIGTVAKQTSAIQTKGIRLRRSAVGGLSKQYSSSPSSRTTYTISAWVKPGSVGTNSIAVWGTPGNWESFRWDSGGTIYWCPGSGKTWTTFYQYAPNTWYHVMVAVDTTQAANAARGKLYINGVQVQNYTSQDTVTQNAQTVEWGVPIYYGGSVIGATGGYGLANPFDGYVSEFYYIDGQALAPTALGQYDANNNWVPKTYTGTYGTNGSYLPMTPLSLGTSSYAAQFGTTTTSQLVTSTNANLALGTNNFTIEYWFTRDDLTTGGEVPVSVGNGINTYDPLFGYTTSSGGMLIYMSSDNANWNIASGVTIAQNLVAKTWYHMAITRSGSTFTSYLNGAQSATWTSASSIYQSANSVAIGKAQNNPTSLKGLISNVRVVIGSVLYTGNFTPSTTPLTAVTNTKLLTLQNSTIVDNSTNALTFTNTSVPATKPVYPFAVAPTYSVQVGGSSAVYANQGGTSAFALSSGTNYTYEFYVYFTSAIADGSTRFLFDARSASSTGSMFLAIETNGLWTMPGPGTGIVNPFSSLGHWYHVAVTRSSGTARLFINGVLYQSGPDTNTTSADKIFIGSRYSSENFTPSGTYFSNFRFINGTALYTATFTPPAAPLTAVTGTQLLTCQSSGIVDNSSNILSMTTIGAPSVSSVIIPPASTGVGKDNSGNNNHWGTRNIDQTTGLLTYDATYDSPTDYVDSNNNSNGNYCTLDSSDVNNGGANVILKNGGLNVTNTNGVSGWDAKRGTLPIPSTGKWYWELSVVSVTGLASGIQVGIIDDQNNITDDAINNATYGYSYRSSGTSGNNGSQPNYGASFTNGDIIGIAIDADLKTITFYKNNVSQGVAFNNIPFSTVTFYPVVNLYTGYGIEFNVNFGQMPFAYAPPAGFGVINTKSLKDVGSYNLPDSFGNFVTSPDLVIIKRRNTTNSFLLADSVRGSNRILLPNDSGAQITDVAYQTFLQNGFGLQAANSESNASGAPYVSWNWNRGQTPGFDIVNYAGTGVAKSVPHSLGVEPKMMVVKQVSTGSNSWFVYHTSVGSGSWFAWNLTNAATSDSTVWNSTNPTSSYFTVGTNTAGNGAGNSYIAYLWAEVPGFSKFGSYTGNGSTDGPFIHCGFKPKWITIKRTDAIGDWCTLDSVRNTYNPVNTVMQFNSPGSDYTNDSYTMDFVSNGFKLRNTANSNLNTSGATYIYMAFAEAPFKYATAR